MDQDTCAVEGCEKPSRRWGLCGMHSERMRKHGNTQGKQPLDPTERFFMGFAAGGPNECWVWKNPGPNGYGRLMVDGVPTMAHRYSYERFVGPIPTGRVIDHLCRNRSCVNPAHMEPVSLVENVMRGESAWAINARKTHCIHGHEFTPENTYRAPQTPQIRQCRACRRIRDKAHRESRR